ncbi:secretin N-terminal domain-containing protein [Brevundimonas sp. VNH65]|uniref:secretin N-terminal domain-containing protein n=1 Tax=Brevundimonas sp. VNH65 TaxID=3400917 RepID=UPI003C026D5F
MTGIANRTGAGRGRSAGSGLGLRAAVSAAPLLLLMGCAGFPALTTGEVSMRDPAVDGASETTGAVNDGTERRPTQRLEIAGARPAVQARQPATQAQIDALVPDAPVDAVLSPQPIPQFVATVFNLLELPYTLTGDVAARTEMIAGGTGGNLSKRALLRVTQQALRQYGVDIYIDGQTVTVGNAAAAPGAAVTRGRNLPTTGGQVVQFFPVQTIEVNTIQPLLTGLFNNPGGNVRVTPDIPTNTLIIAGTGREVAQFVRVLRELDQPRFAGSQALRVEPVFLSAEQLATSLETVLKTEGYLVSNNPTVPRSIAILPFPQSNQVLIFSMEAELLDRIDDWVAELDRPAALGDKATTFVYQVRNTDAASIGSLAIGQQPQTAEIQAPVGVPGTPPATQNTGRSTGTSSGAAGANGASGSGSGDFLGGRVLTDPIGNRILFTGTATEYAQLRTLLTTLDVPAPQVVIEVMIAEVTLTDATSLGVNLFGTDQRGDGLATGSTEGIEIGGGSFRFTFVGPDYRAALVANASNNRVNILQRPQLVARSGEAARFQVGTDVPIITSQAASDSQTGGSTDILQSVQYRQTGTILEIKPVVYGDRVDLTISQELSSAGDAPSGIASPTILNRSLSTRIAVRDGWTGVLGGLIGNNYTKINTGVPFLKDVPVVGSAFQNNRVTGERTELLLLITPYIVRGDEDMADFAERYSESMDAAFRTGRGWSYTLTPWSGGRRFRGIGLDLPSPDAAGDTPSLFPRRGREAPPAAADEAVN